MRPFVGVARMDGLDDTAPFVTIVFAVLFLSNPVVGGVAVWLYIGISLITFGVFRIVFAVKAKQLNTNSTVLSDPLLAMCDQMMPPKS